MSDFSGFSSASRLEIERLKAVLVANGIADEPHCALSQAQAQTQSGVQGKQANMYSNSQPAQGSSALMLNEANVSEMPSRKRHSSQQLCGTSKGLRVVGHNRFEVLTQESSYADKSMRPSSIVSTPCPGPSRLACKPQILTQHNQSVSATRVELLANEVFKEDNLVVSEGVFDIKNDRGFRQEIEIGIETLNGEPFKGTITPQEAKFSIFRESLGFCDFSNFDGVRLAYRNGPVIVFKLKSAINVDELIHVQHFNFQRKSTRQGRIHVDTIGCKIRGLRIPDPNAEKYRSNRNEQHNTRFKQDDGTRTVRIDGCEYRIPKETLLQVLSLYGTVLTDIVEVMFTDGCDPEKAENGSNRTGTYAVKIRLTKKIPQIIPIMGKRIKFAYPGIQRICTNCFGNHGKQVCQSKKVLWHQYVTKFRELNPEFPNDLLQRAGNPKYVVSKTTPDKYNRHDTAAWVASISGNSTCSVDDDSTLEDLTVEVANNPSTSASLTTKIIQPKTVTTNPTSAAAPIVKSGPKESDFKIPQSEEEYNEVVFNLMNAGSSKDEAEQIIGMRKTNYNRACREFKKATMKPVRKSSQKLGQKQSTKSSKQSGNQPTSNGN